MNYTDYMQNASRQFKPTPEQQAWIHRMNTNAVPLTPEQEAARARAYVNVHKPSAPLNPRSL